jgi:hypothetical protein
MASPEPAVVDEETPRALVEALQFVRRLHHESHIPEMRRARGWRCRFARTTTQSAEEQEEACGRESAPRGC